MSSTSNLPKPPPLFLFLTFGVAIGIGVLIAYLGMTGQIGAGIP